MQATAIYKNARMSPLKVRIVANAVRGMDVESALSVLEFNNLKASQLIGKVLKSAVANAENNLGLELDSLFVKSIQIGEGMKLKRIKPRAKGRADRITKRSCHISIVVEEKE